MGLTPGAPILMVSGDASRTGTPRLVRSLVAWITDTTDHPVHLVLERGGPLLADLARAATSTHVLQPGSRPAATELAARGLEELGRPAVGARVRAARRRRPYASGAPQLAWLHGVGSLRHLDALPPGVPVVAHIHELRAGIDRSLHLVDPERALARPDLLVAVSHAVADHLVVDRGVPAERVVVHHGWLPEPWPGGGRAVGSHDERADVTRPLLVGTCGSLGWRKGTDLFLQVAAAVGPSVAGRPVRFTWLGGGSTTDQQRFHHEVHRLGLADRVDLVPERPDPTGWFADLDVFALTSREDPFPLVAMEAGASRLPMVLFDNGGAKELLNHDDRVPFLVPALHVERMAHRIRAVLSDPDAVAGPTARLAATVAAAHTAETAIPHLWEQVTTRLGSTR